jgi:hypothetical protein
LRFIHEFYPPSPEMHTGGQLEQARISREFTNTIISATAPIILLLTMLLQFLKTSCEYVDSGNKKCVEVATCKMSAALVSSKDPIKLFRQPLSSLTSCFKHENLPTSPSQLGTYWWVIEHGKIPPVFRQFISQSKPSVQS